MTPAQRKRTDAAMLDSLAWSFDMMAEGRDPMFSFNPRDIADLMRRCSHEIQPGPKPVEIDTQD